MTRVQDLFQLRRTCTSSWVLRPTTAYGEVREGTSNDCNSLSMFRIDRLTVVVYDSGIRWTNLLSPSLTSSMTDTIENEILSTSCLRPSLHSVTPEEDV